LLEVRGLGSAAPELARGAPAQVEVAGDYGIAIARGSMIQKARDGVLLRDHCEMLPIRE
jgi:hypothetical protein